jgi:hypothetical protein
LPTDAFLQSALLYLSTFFSASSFFTGSDAVDPSHSLSDSSDLVPSDSGASSLLGFSRDGFRATNEPRRSTDLALSAVQVSRQFAESDGLSVSESYLSTGSFSLRNSLPTGSAVPPTLAFSGSSGCSASVLLRESDSTQGSINLEMTEYLRESNLLKRSNDGSSSRGLWATGGEPRSAAVDLTALAFTASNAQQHSDALDTSAPLRPSSILPHSADFDVSRIPVSGIHNVTPPYTTSLGFDGSPSILGSKQLRPTLLVASDDHPGTSSFAAATPARSITVEQPKPASARPSPIVTVNVSPSSMPSVFATGQRTGPGTLADLGSGSNESPESSSVWVTVGVCALLLVIGIAIGAYVVWRWAIGRSDTTSAVAATEDVEMSTSSVKAPEEESFESESCGSFHNMMDAENSAEAGDIYGDFEGPFDLNE